jgi:predicted enzyme related to lactoylglutathione lyase
MVTTMTHTAKAEAGRFCWIDLAATDALRATAFYGQLFGWTPHEQSANGGIITRLHLAGEDVGSLYQMNHGQVDQGARSHWTPYIRVDDVDDTARRVDLLGGRVIVRPFVVSDIARIALIQDSIGANIGLWGPIDTALEVGARW